MRRPDLLVLLSTLAGGCFGPHSQLDPKASVALSGLVQTQAGAAAPPGKVKLIRQLDPLQALGQALETVGTLGLACLGERVDLCSAYEESQSGTDGRYHFGLRGAATQGSGGQALTFTVFSGCGPELGRCAVSADFRIQKETLAIPPLRQWSQPGSSSHDANGDVVLGWSDLAVTVGEGPAESYEVNLTTADGAVVWAQGAGRALSATVDRRVAQDLAARWTVVAARSEPGEGTAFDLRWYAPQLDYPTASLMPLSRGADCYAQGAAARLGPPCPLTDGRLDTRFTPVVAPNCPPGQSCERPPVNNWIVIDLGTSHPLGALVLYDLALSSASSSVVVESSEDQQAWSIQAVLQAKPYQLQPLTGAGRYVRLRLTDPKAQFTSGGNSEIALYAPL